MKDYELKTYHAAVLLKGYFYDKEFPEPIRKAIDHLCEDIQSIMADVNQIVEADMLRDEMERNRKRAERDAKKSQLPQEVEPILERVIATEMKQQVDQYDTGNHAIKPYASIDDNGNIDMVIPEKKPCKPRKPLTPEQLEAMRQRCAEMRERKANKKSESNATANQISSPAKITPPRQDTPADRLIDNHNEYAGERDEPVLMDEDWPDIKVMRKNGLSVVRIASSYNVDLQYMQNFISKMEAFDKAKERSGNF